MPRDPHMNFILKCINAQHILPYLSKIRNKGYVLKYWTIIFYLHAEGLNFSWRLVNSQAKKDGYQTCMGAKKKGKG